MKRGNREKGRRLGKSQFPSKRTERSKEMDEKSGRRAVKEVGGRGVEYKQISK